MSIRKPDELREQFQFQQRAILRSCEAFDSGERLEALRLATAISILMHDKGRSHSVLSQLNLKSKMQFLASGQPINPRNLLDSLPLVKLHVSNTCVEYRPYLGDLPWLPRWMGFKDWWEYDLIFCSGNKAFKVTRKQLVMTLRDQEGGAHFDSKLKQSEYRRMKYGAPWSFFRDGQTEQKVYELELATMRQVAWEVCESLNRANSLIDYQSN